MLYPVNSYRKFRNKLTTWIFTKGFENSESVEVQLVFIHKIKWRKPLEYAELTSSQQAPPHKTHTKTKTDLVRDPAKSIK